MAEERTPAIMDADVRALAAKLKGLHVLLTPAEQALLHLVLRRAAGRDDAPGGTPDAAGSTWAVSFDPFVYLDAIAVDRSAPKPWLAGARRAPAGE
jgi:hypothetical protein